MTQLGMDFDAATLTVAPSPHVQSRQTSAWAALANLPRRGHQNTVVLDLITAAGTAGLSDPELQRLTGYSRQTICLRRFDLRSLLTVAVRRDMAPSGRTVCCWRRKTAEEMVVATHEEIHGEKDERG